MNGVGRPCGQFLLALGYFHSAPEVRSLPSAGITRLHRYYEPLRLPARPGLPSRVSGWSRPHHAGSPVLRSFSLCRHASATTPAGSSLRSGCSPDSDDGGLPQMSAGSAPASIISRPARRSLAFWPACSRSRHKRPCPSKAPAASLPPPPLRLLLAGATLARWELHPLKNDTFARRTPGRRSAYALRLPQIRTCPIKASGSSTCGFARRQSNFLGSPPTILDAIQPGYGDQN
jgi:hypothetical protein